MNDLMPPPEDSGAERRPPPGAPAMNVVRWALFAGLLALAAFSVVSYVVSRRSIGASEHRQARYYCPMHPSYTSDRPGDCPICGMTLEPIPAGMKAGAVAASGAGDVPGLTTVHLTPDRVQMIGVRTAVVERRPMGGQLELVGFVTPDETRLKRIQTRVAGSIEDLYVNRTGQTVAAGDPLLSIYSPELYETEQEYLIQTSPHDSATAAADHPMGHEAGAAAAARTRLELLGVPHQEMERLDLTRAATQHLTLRSNVAGTVLERNVSQGQSVGAGALLFTIADLARVWVIADLYEMDFASVKAGDDATFTADAMPGRVFHGEIEFIYPTVSAETRTLKVRLSLDNHDGTLRPGMFGRVRVAGRASSALVVPDEAVVNTGEHTYVFLAHADGHFEPRLVWTAARNDDRVQIVRGLSAGDTVVASASFLIDSESRLKAAIAGMGQQPQAGHSH